MKRTENKSWNNVASDRQLWLVAVFGAIVGVVFAWLTGTELPGEHALATAVAMIVVYPVLEELAFRGAVQGLLLRWLPGALGFFTKANLITSLVFAGAHYVVQNHPLTWLVFIPSLAFGWSRDRHHNLAGCIGLHVMWNAAFVLGTLI